MWFILVKVPWVLEKDVYSASWVKCSLCVKSFFLIVLFRYFVFLQFLFLVFLSVADSRILKSASIIVDLSISLFSSNNLNFMYLETPLFGTYIFRVIVFLVGGCFVIM